MTPTRVAFIVFSLFLAFLSLYFLLGISSINDQSSESIPEYTPVIQKTGTYTPEGWAGLPISYDNPLYKNPADGGFRYQAAYKSLVKHLLIITQEDFVSQDEELWDPIFSKYTPIIGWNGFFDAFLEARTKRNIMKEDLPLKHSFGEFIIKRSPRPRFAIEVTSRDMLSKAPLHGAVWASIEAAGIMDIDVLFNLVNNELCYFKNDDNMGNIWISCAHGVGHGLGNLFDFDNINIATDICGSPEDDQFHYACATGIFMELEQKTSPRSFYPCDTVRFPGACFRFKNRMFERVFYNTTGACMTQTDKYHRIGCIWGDGHVDARPVTQYFEACKEYLPEYPNQEPQSSYHEACLDGFLAAHEVGGYPEGPVKDKICEDLTEWPKSYNACLFKKNTKLTEFSFDEDNIVYYNTELLERHYDPSITPKAAQWLQKWNQIPILQDNSAVMQPQQNEEHQHNHGK